MRSSRFTPEQVAMALRQAEREPEVEEPRRRSLARQDDLAGEPSKKMVSPALRRELVRWVMGVYRLSERWAMDFVHDTLADGRTIRVLIAALLYRYPGRSQLAELLNQTWGRDQTRGGYPTAAQPPSEHL